MCDKKHDIQYCEHTGKIGYPYLKAKHVMQTLKREGLATKGFHFEIYECKICRRFHIGSQINKQTHKRRFDDFDIE